MPLQVQAVQIKWCSKILLMLQHQHKSLLNGKMGISMLTVYLVSVI